MKWVNECQVLEQCLAHSNSSKGFSYYHFLLLITRPQLAGELPCPASRERCMERPRASGSFWHVHHSLTLERLRCTWGVVPSSWFPREKPRWDLLGTRTGKRTCLFLPSLQRFHQRRLGAVMETEVYILIKFMQPDPICIQLPSSRPEKNQKK